MEFRSDQDIFINAMYQHLLPNALGLPRPAETMAFVPKPIVQCSVCDNWPALPVLERPLSVVCLSVCCLYRLIYQNIQLSSFTAIQGSNIKMLKLGKAKKLVKAKN